jgi:hypothetical protein
VNVPTFRGRSGPWPRDGRSLFPAASDAMPVSTRRAIAELRESPEALSTFVVPQPQAGRLAAATAFPETAPEPDPDNRIPLFGQGRAQAKTESPIPIPSERDRLQPSNGAHRKRKPHIYRSAGERGRAARGSVVCERPLSTCGCLCPAQRVPRISRQALVRHVLQANTVMRFSLSILSKSEAASINVHPSLQHLRKGFDDEWTAST